MNINSVTPLNSCSSKEGKITDGTHEVLELGDLFLQVVCAHLVVLHHTVDLQLLDAVAYGHQLGGTPHKAVCLHGAHTLLQLAHVRLIVPL